MTMMTMMIIIGVHMHLLLLLLVELCFRYCRRPWQNVTFSYMLLLHLRLIQRKHIMIWTSTKFVHVSMISERKNCQLSSYAVTYIVVNLKAVNYLHNSSYDRLICNVYHLLFSSMNNLFNLMSSIPFKA